MHALKGEAPWKHLVQFHIESIAASHEWEIVKWNSKLLLGPYFKTHRYEPFDSI